MQRTQPAPAFEAFGKASLQGWIRQRRWFWNRPPAMAALYTLEQGSDRLQARADGPARNAATVWLAATRYTMGLYELLFSHWHSYQRATRVRYFMRCIQLTTTWMQQIPPIIKNLAYDGHLGKRSALRLTWHYSDESDRRKGCELTVISPRTAASSSISKIEGTCPSCRPRIFEATG